MKQALILHGTDAGPASNWFTWLKEQLEQDGYKVWLPQLPNSDKPNTKTYNQFLLANKGFEFNNETIIIGHSSGAVEVLSLLQHLPEGKKVKEVFLVSAFRDDLGWDALKDLFTEPFDFGTIRTKADKFIFLHSDNDPYCPIEHAEYLAEQVGGELIVKSRQGHFNTEISEKYKAFPELLEIIKNSAASR
jgi:predicted alpha/beta hydrolase family esterase